MAKITTTKEFIQLCAYLRELGMEQPCSNAGSMRPMKVVAGYVEKAAILFVAVDPEECVKNGLAHSFSFRLSSDSGSGKKLGVSQAVA